MSKDTKKGVSSKPKEGSICRICLATGNKTDPLIEPCNCVAELSYCHSSCLSKWIASTKITFCDLCKFKFILSIQYCSFSDWLANDEDEFQQFLVGIFILFISFYVVILGEVTISLVQDSAIFLHLFIKITTWALELAYLGWIIFFSYVEASRFVSWRQSHLRITVSSNPKKKPYRTVTRKRGEPFIKSASSISLRKSIGSPKNQQEENVTESDWDFTSLSSSVSSSESAPGKSNVTVPKKSSLGQVGKSPISSKSETKLKDTAGQAESTDPKEDKEPDKQKSQSEVIFGQRRKSNSFTGLIATGGVRRSSK